MYFLEKSSMFFSSAPSLLMLALVLFLLCRNSVCQDIQGRVNLGSSPGSTTPESFIFNVNVDSGTLPVYFDLYNVIDGSTVDGGAFDEDVTVSCEVTTTFSAGDSVIEFDPATVNVPLRNGATTGVVPFTYTIQSQGRRIALQCQGETVAAQGTTSFFKQDSSPGKTGFVTIKKSPTVSLCADTIQVGPEVTRGQVSLRLSEPVEDSNVTAKCEVTAVSTGDPVNWLAFEDVLVEIGEDTTVVAYRVVDRGSLLTVQCSAQSDIGSQYQTATSMSEATSFEFDTGSIRLVPAKSSVTANQFTPLLVLSDPLMSGEADVTIFCRVSQLNTTTEAEQIIDQGECVVPGGSGSTSTVTVVSPDFSITNTTTLPETTQIVTITLPPNTMLPSTDAHQTSSFLTDAPPGNNTAIWSLVESQFVFLEGDIQKTLDIRLSGTATGDKGVLLVQCCASPGLNTSPKYTGSLASSVAVVNVASARAIDWSIAADSTQLQTETVIDNPAYTEVSPCPCDLTNNRCDVNCCCDQLCSEEDTMTFTCLQGFEGGTFTRQYDYSCSDTNIYRPDYLPFLCVETNNSPYLGLHFTATSGAHDAAAYNTLKSTTTDEIWSTFEESSPRSLEFNDASRGYKFGFPVETLFDSNAGGFLALPEINPMGGCSWGSPVRFQMDTTSRCDIDPLQGLCSESSTLSARAFVLSTNIGYPPCSEAPRIITSYGDSTVAPTTVRYYCRNNITPYLISSTTSDQLFNPTGQSLFPTDDSPNANIPLPNRCEWDDGYTLPPVPEYDSATYLCSGSVLDVRYEIFWQGNQIIQVDAAVVLGSVALTETATNPDGGIGQVLNTPVAFTQRFQVKFTHLSTPFPNPSPVDPPQINPPQVTRSGNPGYAQGSKVLSGQAVEPSQPDGVVEIDDGAANRLRMWMPGPGSLCSQSSLGDITFGDNQISGCLLRLGWDQLSNCSVLRDMMETELRSVVAADRIAMIGNAVVGNQSFWAPVFNSSQDPISTGTPSTTETTTTDPDSVTSGASPLDLIQGLCYDIPTGVNIEILYADAGEVGAIFQQEILSAHVTFTKSIVKLQCIGANGYACHLDQTSDETVDWVQSFPVTSTVVFTKVPPVESQPIISYLTCFYDMCDAETVFLVTNRFRGDSLQYTFGVAAFVTLLTIGYFIVAKPGSCRVW